VHRKDSRHLFGSDASVIHRKINSSSFRQFRTGFGPTLLTACFAFPTTLNMEIVRPSETSVIFYRTKNNHIPEDSSFHNYRFEGLKFNG
jgi:hypothetical protein